MKEEWRSGRMELEELCGTWAASLPGQALRAGLSEEELADERQHVDQHRQRSR